MVDDPSRGAGRRVVEHALQARELLLDRRGHGLCGVFGRCAGEVRRDANRGRRDLRIARDRQEPNREQSEQCDDDRDHGAEDRAPDEEVARLLRRDGRTAGLQIPFVAAFLRAAPRIARADICLDHRARPAGTVVLSMSGTGFTTRPGATFCMPSTTTRSPADQPLVDDPEGAAPRACLHVARDDGVTRTHDVDELSAQALLHGALRNGERALAREAFESHAHELSWQQAPVGVGERCAKLLGAARRIERRRDEVESSRARQQRPVGQDHAHRETAARPDQRAGARVGSPTSPAAATTDGTSRTTGSSSSIVVSRSAGPGDARAELAAARARPVR